MLKIYIRGALFKMNVYNVPSIIKKGNLLIRKILKYKDIKEHVKRDVKAFQNNKKELESRNYSPKLMNLIAELIITRSYWRTWPLDVLKNQGVDLDNAELDQVIYAVESLYKVTRKSFWKATLNSLNALAEIRGEYASLKEWVYEIYDAVKKANYRKLRKCLKDKGIRGLGPKGVNLLLRDLGFFDIVPIDIHERRFLMRTGIALYYGSPSGDPASHEFYANALVNFCNKELKGLSISGIPLDKSPGIVDLIIWYFACEKQEKGCKKVCLSKPKCSICPVKNLCLYALMLKLSS